MGYLSLPKKVPALKVPFIRQNDEFTCVPACLKMVLDYVRQVLLNTAPEMPIFEVKEIAKVVGTLSNGTELQNVRNINKALRRAIPSVEFSVDFSPHDFKEIEEELDARRPVIPWLLMREGERAYEHTIVVTGYDPTRQLIAVNDPQWGTSSEVEVARFMKQWEETERTLIKLRVNQRIQRLISEWYEEKTKELEVVQVASA